MTESVVESWISEESVIAKEGDKERGIGKGAMHQ